MNKDRISRIVALQQERTAKLSCFKTAPSDFRIENKADSSTAIYLYDDIAPWAITAQDFVGELNKIQSDRIDLHINSGGGSVFDGFAIYNSLRQHKAKVKSYIDGVAASAASFIALAAEEVVMAKTSSLMIHDASGLAIGNARDMRELADLLDMLSDQIADIYVAKAGGSTNSWRDLMSSDKWFTAQQAADKGLVDAVTSEENPEGDATDKMDMSFLKDLFFTTATPAPTNALSTPAQEFDFDGLRDALKGVFQ